MGISLPKLYIGKRYFLFWLLAFWPFGLKRFDLRKTSLYFFTRFLLVMRTPPGAATRWSGTPSTVASLIPAGLSTSTRTRGSLSYQRTCNLTNNRFTKSLSSPEMVSSFDTRWAVVCTMYIVHTKPIFLTAVRTAEGSVLVPQIRLFAQSDKSSVRSNFLYIYPLTL